MVVAVDEEEQTIRDTHNPSSVRMMVLERDREVEPAGAVEEGEGAAISRTAVSMRLEVLESADSLRLERLSKGRQKLNRSW